MYTFQDHLDEVATPWEVNHERFSGEVITNDDLVFDEPLLNKRIKAVCISLWNGGQVEAVFEREDKEIREYPVTRASGDRLDRFFGHGWNLPEGWAIDHIYTYDDALDIAYKRADA
jgi:hypothetical protein